MKARAWIIPALILEQAFAAVLEAESAGYNKITAYPILTDEQGNKWKLCNKCGEIQRTDGANPQFSPQKHRSTGLSLSCKSCVRVRNNAWYQKNQAYKQAKSLTYKRESKDRERLKKTVAAFGEIKEGE